MEREFTPHPQHDPLAQLNDLRILKMAQMHEQAFTHFVDDIVSPDILDEGVQFRVAQVASPADRTHARLAAESARIAKDVGANQFANRERALVLDILELAVAEREFFVSHMDELHDPRTVRLFRDLIRSQELRVQRAREALQRADARSSGEKAAVSGEAALGPLLSEEEVPLREGVTDYGRGR